MTSLQAIFNNSAPVDTVGDKAVLSLTTLLLGMLTVFSVLLIIMIVLVIIGSYFKRKDKKAQKTKEVTPVEVTPPQPVIEETHSANDEEIVAVITAAVAMCLEEPIGSFRVVSFRKTSTKPAWTKK